MKKIKVIKPIPMLTKSMIMQGCLLPVKKTLGGDEYVEIYDSESGLTSISYVLPLIKRGYAKYVPEKPKTVWDLKMGDEYWYINIISAELLDISRAHIKHARDERRLVAFISVGLAFVTEEECEKEFTKRRAIYKIKKYCAEKGWNLEWGVRKLSFYQSDRIDCTPNSGKNGNPIGYFDSTDEAVQILKTFPEELKTILS